MSYHPLPLNVKAIKEVNKLFFAFLWNGKGDKIKRNTIINDYPNGGLKMIGIVSFSKSLKATWIKKYLDAENRGKWKYLKDDSNNFLSLTELQTGYGITVCPLKYCGTLSTIKLQGRI